MDLLIQGIGGIGGVLAGELWRAGLRPTLVTGNVDIARAMGERGLTVKTPSRSFAVHPPAYAQVSDIPLERRFDAALLITKANTALDAARQALPRLKEGACVVSLHNGIVEDDLAAELGPERVMSAIVGWGGTMHAPGVVERTGPGKIHLGELDRPASGRARVLGRLLQAASPVDVNDNMRGVLWSKLAINAAITSLGALAGRSLGELLKARVARQAFLGVYAEVLDTAWALGVVLEPVAARPELFYLAKDASWARRLVKDSLVRVVGHKYRLLRSSMLQSLERGRPTEVEFLNGYVMRKAIELGRQVPYNRAVTRMIHEIENGQRQSDPRNLKELVELLEEV